MKKVGSVEMGSVVSKILSWFIGIFFITGLISLGVGFHEKEVKYQEKLRLNRHKHAQFICDGRDGYHTIYRQKIGFGAHEWRVICNDKTTHSIPGH